MERCGNLEEGLEWCEMYSFLYKDRGGIGKSRMKVSRLRLDWNGGGGEANGVECRRGFARQ